MLQTMKNAWRTPDLRKKLIYVCFILVLYRIGTVIPVPFVDAGKFGQYFGGTILEYMDMLSGGSLFNSTLFALGISPYITASIIIQLLGVAFPRLAEWIKGQNGRNEMLTCYTTVGLSIITGLGYYLLLERNSLISQQIVAMNSKFVDVLVAIVIISCYCAGASIVMWLGEKINENGIGNGISLILFANIISSVPSTIIKLGNLVGYGINGTAEGWAKVGYIAAAVGFALLMVAIAVLLTVFVIFITGSERRIPVTYAKRVVGRKMYGGQSTNLPIKLNMTGVMPVIFASSIISLVPTILTLCGVTARSSYADCKTFWEKMNLFLSADRWFYPVFLFVLIIAFSYFYASISFNTVEVSNNLKKNGGMIPGIRQGRPTSDFISAVVKKVTLVGALFLGVIAVLPIIASPLALKPIVSFILENDPTLAFYKAYAMYYGDVFGQYVSSYTSALSFGGTSLLIVVGVVQETFRELEAQLTMRNYKGFL